MTTATILQPTSHHPAARASVYPTPAAPVSNMISSEPGKSGRAPGAADVKDLPFRQSLPSISNALKVAEPRQFQLPAPPSMQPTSSFTSPFTSGHRGSYPDGDKHGSPHTIHHSFPPRQELSNAYADSPRSSFHGRPGLPAVPDRRPSPPLRPDLPPHHLTEAQRAHDPHHPLNNGAYAHPPPPAPPHPAGPYAHGPLHPGQVPLPGHPISPHRAGPPGPHPYDPSGPPSPHPDDANRARYDTGRHFETWEYPTALARVAQSARTVFNFAEAYHRIASEQSRSPLMPERLTTDHEIAEMLSRTDLVKRSLEQVREHVHQCAQSERIRDSAKQPKDPYDDDDDDVAMYSEHMKAPQYTMRETKKRRGRAAPPGRCHSCKRIDTPEWRRGPNGARTLCNACGLHYAKLEEKRQLEARQIRPKHDERP